ncbi:hypothetical protein VTI74DRAFT_2261 [Chaetomium olivicolor]
MRFIATAGFVAFAASTAAASTPSSSSSADLDPSVWENLLPVNRPSFLSHARNRPVKRQSGWNPPSELATPLKEVWDHCLNTYSDGNLFGFKNYGWDQIMATNGSLNMCVRWDSSSSVTAAQRTQIATVLNEQYQKWFQWLYGYDNFPFSKISVNVVGWAVRNTDLLEGDTSDIDVYTNADNDGVPECAPACGRSFHQDGDYSSCPNGADRHYDQSLWLTDGLNGGFGGDWGQQVGKEYFLGALSSGNIHILLHEMGHTFGLDDFYDWTPTGVRNFIMLAGSSTEITEFDGWMLRNWWYELSRNRGWQLSSGSGIPSKTTSPAPVATSSAPQQGTAVVTTPAAPVTSSAPQQGSPVGVCKGREGSKRRA